MPNVSAIYHETSKVAPQKWSRLPTPKLFGRRKPCFRATAAFKASLKHFILKLVNSITWYFRQPVGYLLTVPVVLIRKQILRKLQCQLITTVNSLRIVQSYRFNSPMLPRKSEEFGNNCVEAIKAPPQFMANSFTIPKAVR